MCRIDSAFNSNKNGTFYKRNFFQTFMYIYYTPIEADQSFNSDGNNYIFIVHFIVQTTWDF